MEILDTNKTTSKSFWWNRKWGEWQTSWHEKNALITKFLHEYFLCTNLD